MSGLDSLIEHQGFYDYLNHFISGAVFIIGFEIITKLFGFSLIQKAYEFIGLFPFSNNDNEFLWNVCVVALFGIVSFLIGVAAQELYGIIFDHHSAIINPNGEDIISNYIFRLFHKTTVRKCVHNMLIKGGPITNKHKLDQYKELARDFIAQTPTLKEDKKEGLTSTDFENELLSSPDFASYFFAYCVYYIQIKSQNRKTEKLRDIEGLSEALSLIFLTLTFLSAIATIISYYSYAANSQADPIRCIASVIICAIYGFFSILMDCRTEKAIKNRIRMTLAIYDVEKRQENKQTPNVVSNLPHQP